MKIYCLPLIVILLPNISHAQWVDTFDTLNPAWVTDRYAPAAFQPASFNGDNRLQITIDQTGSTANRPSPTYSSTFYNFQGDQRPVGIMGAWSYSAEVYVSSAFDTTTGQLVSSGLAAHSGTNSSDGDYGIFAFTNGSPTDPLNPAAPDRSFRFEFFDGTAADPTSWFDLGLPLGFAFDAWHSMAISSTGTSFDYSLDNQLLFSDPTTAGINLQTAFLEAYNSGQTDSNGLNNYSVYWDNAVTAAVIPEPSRYSLVAGLTLLGLVWKRRNAAKSLYEHPQP